MSLSSPHPLWLTATSNPYEINKAIVQARMLSGRYRTEGLCRFWSANPNGFCLLQSCSDSHIKEDILHLLVTFPSLESTRSRLRTFFHLYAVKNPEISTPVHTFLTSPDPIYHTQFLLDCSTIPEIIQLKQELGLCALNHLFYLTRTWCYSVHRERLRQLGRWKFI